MLYGQLPGTSAQAAIPPCQMLMPGVESLFGPSIATQLSDQLSTAAPFWDAQRLGACGSRRSRSEARRAVDPGCYPAAGALIARPANRDRRADEARTELPLAPVGHDRQQRWRRHRARSGSAARRVADEGSVPGVAGGPERVPPGPALRRPRWRRGGPLQPSAHGHRGQPGAGRCAGRPRRHDRQWDGQHRHRPRHLVRPRHGRDLRRLRQQHAPAGHGRSRGPRHRQRAPAGRLPADEPARGPADRRLPVRRRHGDPVRDERGLLRPRSGARVAGRDQHDERAARAIEPAGGDGGGDPLAPRRIRRCGPWR